MMADPQSIGKCGVLYGIGWVGKSISLDLRSLDRVWRIATLHPDDWEVEFAPDDREGGADGEQEEKGDGINKFVGAVSAEPSWSDPEDEKLYRLSQEGRIFVQGYCQVVIGDAQMRSMVGSVFRWTCDLVRGSGSIYTAFLLAATLRFSTMQAHDLQPTGVVETGESLKKRFNYFGVPQTEHQDQVNKPVSVQYAAWGPLGVWAFQSKIVSISEHEEPLPLPVKESSFDWVIKVFDYSLRAGVESKLGRAGLDGHYLFRGVAAPVFSDLEIGSDAINDEIVQQIDHSMLRSGVMILSTGEQNRVPSLPPEHDTVVVASTVPLWTVEVWLQGSQVAHLPSPTLEEEVVVDRTCYPIHWSLARDARVDGLPGYWTEATSQRKEDLLYLPCGDQRDKSSGSASCSWSILMDRREVRTLMFMPDWASIVRPELSTMALLPHTFFRAPHATVQLFIRTPHGVSSESILPLTHMRIPASDLAPRLRKSAAPAAAISRLASAFR
jgi:hypothetical protein